MEDELTRLEELGIIRARQFADWAAPIVPVLKDDGAVRICGDYRVTINGAMKVDTYPLPRIEELFAAMSGGVLLTKLDLMHAYVPPVAARRGLERLHCHLHPQGPF